MAESQQTVTYLNGRFIPHSEALAEMSENESQSAGGFYDAERTFGGQVFKLRQHLERLYRGSEHASIDPDMSLDEMEGVALEVLEANRKLLKPEQDFILGQVVSIGPKPSAGGPRGANVIVYCQFIDFSEFARSYSRGVRVVTPVTYAVPPQPSSAGGDGAQQETMPLMTDGEGNVTECRHANFMFVKDGRIGLPNRRNVLPGISMETVLELAESVGVPVDEGDYSSGDVYDADEAFVSGTRFCLLPVATLNGVSVGDEVPGAVTGRLLSAWSERVGMDIAQQALNHLPPERPGTQIITR